MNLRTFFKAVLLLGVIGFCAILCTALTNVDWNAKGNWSAVGKCGEHDNCNLTSGFVSHRICSPEGKTIREVRVFPDNMQTRPNVGSKVIRLEKKAKKPIKYGVVIWHEWREFDMNDSKMHDEFWAASLEEQKKYPLTLRRKFVHTRRARKLRAEYDEWRKKNPDRPPPPLNPKQEPYTDEEKAILGTDDRRLTAGEKLSCVRNGKFSNQSKIGNKVINLEVQ